LTGVLIANFAISDPRALDGCGSLLQIRRDSKWRYPRKTSQFPLT
jgi:hypothetical protein